MPSDAVFRVVVHIIRFDRLDVNATDVEFIVLVVEKSFLIRDNFATRLSRTYRNLIAEEPTDRRYAHNRAIAPTVVRLTIVGHKLITCRSRLCKIPDQATS